MGQTISSAASRVVDLFVEWSPPATTTTTTTTAKDKSAEAPVDNTTSPRNATSADHVWLVHHWSPHYSRIPQLFWESRNLAHSPVTYVAGGHCIGEVDAASDPGKVWPVTTCQSAPYERVRVEWDALRV